MVENSVFKFNQNSIASFILVLSLFFISSCQKENLIDEALPSNPIEQGLSQEEQELNIKGQLLTDILGLPQKMLSADNNIETQFDEFMEQLPTDARQLINDQIEQALNAPTSSNPVNFRNGQSSIINAPDGSMVFGSSVATQFNDVIIGSENAVYIYKKNRRGNGYEIKQTITNDANNFGAKLAVSGPWLAIGAPNFSALDGPGQVFIYKRVGGNYVLNTSFTGPADQNLFGNYLDIDDGTLAVIGREFIGQFQTQGRIFVYEASNSNGNWQLKAELVEPTYNYIDIKVNGDYVVASGWQGSLTIPPSISIYKKNIFSWGHDANVNIFDTELALIGYEVEMVGNTIAVIALLPNTKVYMITQQGGNWAQSSIVEHPEPPFITRRFDMNASKLTIGVSSPIDFASDLCHIFDGSGTNWTYSETVTPSDNGAGVGLIEVSANSGVTVAGATFSDFFNPAAGKVYVFE